MENNKQKKKTYYSPLKMKNHVYYQNTLISFLYNKKELYILEYKKYTVFIISLFY